MDGKSIGGSFSSKFSPVSLELVLDLNADDFLTPQPKITESTVLLGRPSSSSLSTSVAPNPTPLPQRTASLIEPGDSKKPISSLIDNKPAWPSVVDEPAELDTKQELVTEPALERIADFQRADGPSAKKQVALEILSQCVPPPKSAGTLSIEQLPIASDVFVKNLKRFSESIRGIPGEDIFQAAINTFLMTSLKDALKLYLEKLMSNAQFAKPDDLKDFMQQMSGMVKKIARRAKFNNQQYAELLSVALAKISALAQVSGAPVTVQLKIQEWCAKKRGDPQAVQAANLAIKQHIAFGNCAIALRVLQDARGTYTQPGKRYDSIKRPELIQGQMFRLVKEYVHDKDVKRSQ